MTASPPPILIGASQPLDIKSFDVQGLFVYGGHGEITLNSEFLLPLIVILIGSQLAGRLCRRVNLPSVFGVLLVGLILGPSVLGWVRTSESLTQLSELGVLILMFLAGLETDTVEMRKLGATSFLTALGGVLLPFAGGTLVAMAFGVPLLASLFVGAILTATSVSISARTLQELGRLQSREGTVILGAAVIDDVMGVVVLSIVIGVAGGGDVLFSILKMLLFFPVAIIAGYLLMPTLTKWLKDWQHHEAELAVVLAVVLIFAWASEVFGGMAAVTGAYLAGLLVGRTEIATRVNRGASALGYAFFIPLFFVSIGVETQASSLGAMPWMTVVLIAVAIVTKAAGCFVGARVGGSTRLESLRIGTGMISRGEVALVIATLGLNAHVIDAGIFSMTVMMALVTTLLTPLLLKVVYMLPDPAARASEIAASLLTPASSLQPIPVLATTPSLRESEGSNGFQPI